MLLPKWLYPVVRSVPSGIPYDIHTIDNQYYVLGKTKGGLISELLSLRLKSSQKSVKELSSLVRTKVGNYRVMKSKSVVLRVAITELPTLV